MCGLGAGSRAGRALCGLAKRTLDAVERPVSLEVAVGAAVTRPQPAEQSKPMQHEQSHYWKNARILNPKNLITIYLSCTYKDTRATANPQFLPTNQKRRP